MDISPLTHPIVIVKCLSVTNAPVNLGLTLVQNPLLTDQEMLEGRFKACSGTVNSVVTCLKELRQETVK